MFNHFGDQNQQVAPNNSLEVLIGPNIRSITKKIKEKFNGLSQHAWVKKMQIYQTGPLYSFWAISKAISTMFL